MQFRFHDTEYHFPDSLSEITLGQRIAFHEQYGKDLDERAAKISAIKDAFDQEAELNTWHLDNAAQTFSFYTSIPLATVSSGIAVLDLLHIYNTDMKELFDQERNALLKESYVWMGEEWLLTNPELKATDKMTFNEFIVSKEIVRALHGAGKGKWETLPYLCAIYLRRRNEPFIEDFVQEDSDRLKLMMSLPLDIAIAVGFFLSGTLSIYIQTFHYSSEAEQKESTPAATLKNGDG